VSDRPASSSLFGGLAKFGDYFQLISIIPAAVVVLITYLLVAGGAPTHRPSWYSIGLSIKSFNLATGSALIIAVVTVGMTLHPFQFVAIQFLEGYWGPTNIGRIAMFTRARVHHSRWRRYQRCKLYSEQDHKSAIEYLQSLEGASLTEDKIVEAEIEILRSRINWQEFTTASDRYPRVERDSYPMGVGEFMPTRLGNILRRYENIAGRPYGLEAPAIVPHLMKLAPSDQVAYVNDARMELDLAVRFVLSWTIVAALSFVLVWQYDLWLAVPLAAYGLAWVSYRASIHAAEGYGHALFVLIDLNHDKLDSYFQGKKKTSRSRNVSSIASRERDY
jgi:hypothetical protein